jgi:diguanylate cyclase (GGDEF)-like protein/PAS domain S-box-containing protein
MSLRNKALLIIVATIGGTIAVLFVVLRLVVMGAFTRLEEQQVRQNVEQARAALFEELQSLSSACGDWAPWDETYRFAQDANPGYVVSNLAASTFQTLRLNLAVFLDGEGKLVYGTGFDLRRNCRTPIPRGLAPHIARGAWLARREQADGQKGGLLVLPEGPMVVSARPILTSERTGPVRGTLIFGRYLDAARLTDITHLAVSLTASQVSRPAPAPGPNAIPDSQRQAVVLRPLSEQTMGGFDTLADVYGTPALVLQVSVPRTIYQQANRSALALLLSLLGVGLIAGTSAYGVVGRTMIRRVARLNAGVRHVAETGDAGERLSTAGRDELDELADGINAMLESLQRSEEAAREERDRLEMLTEAIGVGIAVISRDYRTLWANRVLKAVFGEVEGSCCHITYNQRPEVCEGCGVREVFETGCDQAVHEQVGQDKHGNTVWSQIVATPIRDREGNITAALEVVVPITERKRAEETIRHQAHYDALTDLPNRAFFYELLGRALGDAAGGQASLAVILLDLDRFKRVNDSLGHQCGDELLQQVAERLRGCLRQDDVVCRLGGDEFAVLLPRVGGGQDAATVARKLLATVRDPFSVAGSEVRITVSAGVSLCPGDAQDEHALVRNADTALYRAKEGGRDTFHFYSPSWAEGPRTGGLHSSGSSSGGRDVSAADGSASPAPGASAAAPR